MTQREFNTFGPVNPDEHYHVDRIAVKAALRTKIEKGRYLTLNAGRQMGKTTLFSEMIHELETNADYFGILLDFELLRGFAGSELYERLGKHLADWREAFMPAAPLPFPMRNHGDFIDWLRATIRHRGKRGVLIIDEFDAIDAEAMAPLLSLFRGMYLQRRQSNAFSLHSILLVGVRNIPSILGGTQSPFNIADQFVVPPFSADEVADLLLQHSRETGQLFLSPVIETIMAETEGQPFLVNRLAQILTQTIVTDRNQAITATHLDYALARLLSENNSHFYSILSKATPHQLFLMPILLYNQSRNDFLDDVTQELIMYGVLRVIDSAKQLPSARIGNPIYRKMLLLRFSSTIDTLSVNGNTIHRFAADGVLDFDGLLDNFQAFMREHGVRLLKSAKSERPLEISGQYLLLSYLSAALNSIGGQVTIESVSSAGEIDILAFYQGYRFIIETKIWYGIAKYEEGKTQLLAYLRAAGLSKGYLVVFDEKLHDNLLHNEKGITFELNIEGHLIRVYLIGVTV